MATGGNLGVIVQLELGIKPPDLLTLSHCHPKDGFAVVSGQVVCTLARASQSLLFICARRNWLDVLALLNHQGVYLSSRLCWQRAGCTVVCHTSRCEDLMSPYEI